MRDGLAADDGVLDILFPDIFMTAESMFYFGVSVFGSAGEEKRVVDYGQCRRDNIAWALNPASSCVAPGCVDPYAAPSIQWTFQDGSMINPPGFKAPTLSHMPDCDAIDPQPQACGSSGNALHLGLQLVASNLQTHRTACGVTATTATTGTAGDDTGETGTDPSEMATDKACGCTSNEPGAAPALLLLGLLGLRRRRARA